MAMLFVRGWFGRQEKLLNESQRMAAGGRGGEHTADEYRLKFDDLSAMGFMLCKLLFQRGCFLRFRR
jgi:hypothetical protein